MSSNRTQLGLTGILLLLHALLPTAAAQSSGAEPSALPANLAGISAPGTPSSGTDSTFSRPIKIRPELVPIVKAAETLIDNRDYSSALVKLEETSSVALPTIDESQLINQLRARAALGAGDTRLASDSVNSALTGEGLSADDKIGLMHAMAGLYYRKGDYPQAVVWSQREIAAGAGESAYTLLAQSYYKQGNDVSARDALAARIRVDELRGQTPPQEDLVLLASCYGKENNATLELATLEQLVTYYPNRQYWRDLVLRTEATNKLPERLTLDMYQIQYNLGTLATADEFMEMAALDLKAGYPSEAKSVLDQGFSLHLLGSGPDLALQQKLVAIAERRSTADVTSRADADARALRERDSTHLVTVGFDYVVSGEPKRGIPLIEAALRTGTLQKSADATLKLGIANLFAGNNARALELFQSIPANLEEATPAHLWAVRARQG